jgi:hypothetical protein
MHSSGLPVPFRGVFSKAEDASFRLIAERIEGREAEGGESTF